MTQLPDAAPRLALLRRQLLERAREHALVAVLGGRLLARGGHVTRYDFDAVLEVAGGPARSPYDPAFDAKRLPRVEVFANQLEQMLDRLEQSGTRYVSDGDPQTVARPAGSHVMLGRAAH